ncbi:MAG: hypothetical protein ACPGAN_00295 [Candidatus Poseidoniaceae archaeon]
MKQPIAWSKSRTNRMIECEIAFCKEYSYFQKPSKQKIRTPWEIMLYCSRISMNKYLEILNEKRGKCHYSSLYDNLELLIRKESSQNNILLKSREIHLQKKSRNIPFIDEKMLLKLVSYAKKRVSSFLQTPLIEELEKAHTSWYTVDNLNSFWNNGKQIYSAPNLVIESNDKIRLITFQLQNSSLKFNHARVSYGNLIWALENEYLPDESALYKIEIYSWSGSGWDTHEPNLDETEISSFKSQMSKDIEKMGNLILKYKKSGYSKLKGPESKLTCKRCRNLDFCNYSLLD